LHFGRGFFTEWKLGNTPNEKSRNPAFGGVFTSFFEIAASAVERWHDSSVVDLLLLLFGGFALNYAPSTCADKLD
jgi:hypothetical protein